MENKTKQEILELLKELIEVNSTYDLKTISDDNPYGTGVSKAFQVVSRYCQRNEIHHSIYNNQVLEVVFGDPKATKSLGILGHLDVVPVSPQWQDGFKLIQKDGYLYGRGVVDDKGPMVINLIALKNFFLRHPSLLLNNDINFKVIFGGDEERGSTCLDAYFGIFGAKPLVFGYTPDSSFPIVYGEKGGLTIGITGSLKLKYLLEAKHVNAANVVPDYVELVFKNSGAVYDSLETYRDYSDKKLKYTVSAGKISLKVLGRAAHASLSHLGHNAIYEALTLINMVEDNKEISHLLKVVPNAQGTLVDLEDKESELGKLTFNLGLLSIKDRTLSLIVDSRFNELTNVQGFISYLQDYLQPLSVVLKKKSDFLLMDKNSEHIRALIKAYNKITDANLEPITSGGGTYAKHAKNVIAFGPELDDTAYDIHSDYEKINEEEYFGLYDIYYEAIKNLMELYK